MAGAIEITEIRHKYQIINELRQSYFSFTIALLRKNSLPGITKY